MIFHIANYEIAVKPAGLVALAAAFAVLLLAATIIVRLVQRRGLQ